MTRPAKESVPPSVDGPGGLFGPALAAARANFVPAVLLWIFGSAIVASYYLWPAARPVFAQVTVWRAEFGLVYPMVSTALFAGLVPYLMQGLQRGGPPQRRGATVLAYLLIFWALKGIEVEMLYRLQARMFGDSPAAATLAAKTLFDQLVYIPVWGAPTLVLGMLFAQCGFSLRRMRHHARAGWYWRLVVPLMIPNWIVWFPAVVLIYMLPTALQLPMQNIVLCFWVLIVLFLTERQNADTETTQALP